MKKNSMIFFVIIALIHLCDCFITKNDPKSINTMLLTRNVSRLLDQLMKDYDKRLRPNYAGQPVEVGVTININNINAVSEVNMDYTIDMYIRQYWFDKRLAFQRFDGVDELVIGSDMLHKIWTPDTFLENERKSYFHRAPSHNKFIRIQPDGQLLFSMRLTVTAACPMNFRYFPMDHQACHLEIESYGFRYDDIHYKWAQGLEKSLDITPNILLPQFKLTKSTLKERKIQTSTGIYSRLTMTLSFMRNLGYYIIQIYIPSSMIVILSFVSFWIDRTAAPARVTLGITTVLTMVTFIWSTNASLPKISYVKGIDVYLVCCFFMTFACVIEYGLVSFIHRRHERRKRLITSLQKSFDDPKAVVLNFNSFEAGGDSPVTRCLCLPCGKNNQRAGNGSKMNAMPDSNSSPLLWKKHLNGGEINASRYTNGAKNINLSNSDLSESLNIKYNHLTNSVNLQQSKSENGHRDHSDDECIQKRHKNGSYRPRHDSYLKVKNSYDNRKRPTLVSQAFSTGGEITNKLWAVKACTIDNCSRVLFPVVFFCFHVVYWTYYLNISSES